MSTEEKKKESLPPEEKEKYRRLYDIGKDSFLEQLSRIDSLDRKAQINLVVIGIEKERGQPLTRDKGFNERVMSWCSP
jgi:hypothetical protein